jgi:plastocyanin
MRRLVIAVVAALALAMVGAGSVSAHSGKQVRTIGGNSFKANQFVKSTFRFAPGKITVDRGDKVTFVDRDQDADDPHTATIVNQADLPTTFDEVFECEACNDALAAHDPGNDGQPPFNLVVNKGNPGLDTPGDSLLFGGELDNQSIRARVTAAKGTTLYYLCALHPWMQGSIKVRR